MCIADCPRIVQVYSDPDVMDMRQGLKLLLEVFNQAVQVRSDKDYDGHSPPQPWAVCEAAFW